MTTNLIPFKTRAKDEMIACAKVYKSTLLDYEYLVCSKAFVKYPYYIISAYKGNYKHLTGVESHLSPDDFFDKCLDGTLTENDFSFVKPGYTEAEVKGSVRRKLSVLHNIDNIFSSQTQIEEDFIKGNIHCSFATANSECTIGFSISKKVKPKTLLKGNILTPGKSCGFDLVLRKLHSDDKFNTVLIGDEDSLNKYNKDISNIIDLR